MSEVKKYLKLKPICIGSEDVLLNVSVEYSRRRSISLSVSSPEDLLIKAPLGLSEKQIRSFINSREKWILGNVSRLSESGEAGIGRGIIDGRILYFLGEPRRVVLSGTRIAVLKHEIHIPVKFGTEDLENWYRVKSRGLVTDFLEKNQSKLPEFKIKIRKQNRIWGSCNSKGNININSRISMCRPPAVEYVLWHEICHLSHMNHSKEFYLCLEKVFPEYNEEKKWLRNNAHLLRI